jgi:beta-galactosidase
MKIGTYYYPEQWPREQWKRDFRNIADLGLQIVHMGEFAWFEMEPKPGDIRLDWLEECVSLARKNGLEVILCTPTASPPVWLVQEHPDVMPIDEAGRQHRFGGRRHYSPTAPAMLDATRRIVTALADRFAGNPSVVGWQIDNEYSSAGFFDQNQHAHSAFRAWLKDKFASVDALNKAWGCQFWNTYYTDLSQVLLPAQRTSPYANPHHLLDACRFWSWAYAQFNKVQADILRSKISGLKSKAQPFITHNFMPMHPEVDPGMLAGDMDLVAWDTYPVYGQDKAPANEAFRMGDPAAIGLGHDVYASFRGRWAVMELQPGQVNWGATPTLLYPGAVRLWLWTAFGHGAEFVTTYRYRQPRFGIEMFHQGLVGPDGVTATPGGRQFQQAVEEMKVLKAREQSALAPAAAAPAAPSVPQPDALPTAPAADAMPAPVSLGPQHSVGLLFDWDQLWWFSILPQGKRWDYVRFVRQWHGAFSQLGLRVRVIRPGQPLPSDLPLIVAPAVQMVDDATIKQFTDYAKGGGHLVLTCRTGLMDRNGQLFEGPVAKPILPLIGGTIDAYDGLPEETFGSVEMDGQHYAWGVWGDLLYAEPTTKVLARYADQFYASAAAVLQNKVGKGTVTYCGVAGEQAFIDALVSRLITPPVEAAPAPRKRRRKDEPPPVPKPIVGINPVPPRTRLLRRGKFWVFLNYQPTPVDAPAPANVNFLVGQRTVDPAGVAVWED